MVDRQHGGQHARPAASLHDDPGRPSSSVTCSAWAGSKTSSSLSFENVVSLASMASSNLALQLENMTAQVAVEQSQGTVFDRATFMERVLW